MRILRVSSITHTRLPEGLIDGLDGKTLIDMNEAYSAQAEVKDERIKQVFRSLMAKTVITSTDSETPSKDIANLLLGEIKKQA
jgi:transcriptional regulator NrdR family protein